MPWRGDGATRKSKSTAKLLGTPVSATFECRLYKFGEGEGFSGLVLEGELDVAALESLLDAFPEPSFVSTQMVSSLLVQGVIRVGISKEGSKANNDGAESQDGDPIAAKNV